MSNLLMALRQSVKTSFRKTASGRLSGPQILPSSMDLYLHMLRFKNYAAPGDIGGAKLVQ